MITKDKLSWSEITERFSQFEEGFNQDVTDPTLLKFFDNFANKVIASDLSEQQLQQVTNRMANLRKLFARKAESLKASSNNAITKHKQLNQYIKNSNYKT